MSRFLIYLVLWVFIFIGCTKIPSDKFYGNFLEEFIDTIPSNCRLQPNENNLTGKIIVDNLNYHYFLEDEIIDFPQSKELLFYKSFYAYHFKTFFDEIHLEDKLQSLFLDSIQIKEVYLINESNRSRLMKKCQNCNVYAVLGFKGNLFNFPMQLSTEKLDVSTQFDFKQNLNGYPEVLMTYSKKSSNQKYFNGLFSAKKYKGKLKRTLILNEGWNEVQRKKSLSQLSSFLDLNDQIL